MSESLRDYTSLHLGGPARRFFHAKSEEELMAAVQSADASDEPILIIGGGSNLLIADNGFAGSVIRVENKGINVTVDACSGGMIDVAAGESWDEFVTWSVDNGFVGLETLAGIPGTVGAAPIQNIGAYGSEVSQSIARVRTWDRKSGSQRTFSNSECRFGYRHSIFKQERDRYVILQVTFQLERGELSQPIKYEELARFLGAPLESRVDIAKVRAAVLSLRALKGMLLNPEDEKNWSAGSFFVNPIVSAAEAARLPEAAPRWPQSDGRVKTSAAWLMEQAGIQKGKRHGGAGISEKHVLALLNNGSATAAELIDLARSARAAVRERFGITLEPEVQFIGLSLD